MPIDPASVVFACHIKSHVSRASIRNLEADVYTTARKLMSKDKEPPFEGLNQLYTRNDHPGCLNPDRNGSTNVAYYTTSEQW